MLRQLLLSATPVVGSVMLSACGGGGSSSPPPPPPPANVAPVAALSIAETSVREGNSFSLDASGSTDSNGDRLSYSYRVASGPSTDLSGASGSTASVTAPDVDANATLTVEVTVTDGRGGSDTATASIDVLNNNAPDVSLSVSETTAREADLVVLDVFALDRDGDALNYTYRVVSGPAVDLSEAVGASVGIILPDVDADTDIVFEVTVDDGRDTATEQVTVSIVNNTPPVAVLVARDKLGSETASVIEGQPITLDAFGTSDAENDQITFSYIQIAGPEADIPATRASSVGFDAPEVDADAVLTFEVQADDGRDVSVARVDVTVENLVLEPDAGFEAELTATLRTERRIVAMFGGTNSDGLVFVRGPGDTIDAVTTTLSEDATAFLPLVDVQGDVAAGLGFVRDIVDVPTASNTVAIIGERGIRFAEFDIQRQGDTLSAGAWTDLGTLSVDGACAIAVDNNVRSFGATLYVGRSPESIAAYGFSTLPDSRQIDVSSLEFVDDLDVFEEACALSSPRFVDSATATIIGVDIFRLQVNTYQLVDQGAGTAELTQLRTTNLVPATEETLGQVFVDAAKTGFSGQLAVVVSDDIEGGKYGLIDLRLPLDNSLDVDVAPLFWSFGRPSSVASIRYKRRVANTSTSESFFLVPLPETPFALSAPNNGFATDTGRAFAVGYSEVGLGLDGSVIASQGEGVFGRGTTNSGPSFLLYNSETGVIRRFGITLPD